MKGVWEILPFGDVCEISGGSQPPKSNFIYNPKEGYIRLVQVRDYRTDKYKTYIPKERAKKKCSSTDIMIGRYGPPIFGIFSGIEGAYNVALMKAIPDENKLNKEYFRWFLKSHDLMRFVEKTSKRAAGQDGVRKDRLYTYPVPIPPLPVQKQIVTLLDSAFAKIDQAKVKLEKNIANAKELFQVKLSAIFSQKGDGWMESKLGDIADFRNGMNYSKSSNGELIHFVGVGNFKNYFFVPVEDLSQVSINGKLKDEDRLKDGDILTVRSNGNPQLIGRCILANGINKTASHSGFTIRIRLKEDSIYPNMLCFFLKSANTRKQLVESGNGIGIRSLNQGSLSKLNFTYPREYQKQVDLTNKLSEISLLTQDLISTYEAKINEIEELKKSLLQKALAGELT